MDSENEYEKLIKSIVSEIEKELEIINLIDWSEKELPRSDLGVLN